MREIYSLQLPLKKNICHKQKILAEIQQSIFKTITGLSDKDKTEISRLFKELNGETNTATFMQDGLPQYQFIINFPGRVKLPNMQFNTDDIVIQSSYFMPSSKERGIYIDEFNLFDLNKTTLYTKVYVNEFALRNCELETIEDVYDGYDVKPQFARWFLKHRLCGETVGFRISNWPIRLRYEDGFNVKNIIEQSTKLDMPIVLSRIPQTDYDINRLYTRLTGAILILTEDDPGMFEWLSENIENYAEKLGDIIPDENELAIYYPRIKEPCVYEFPKEVHDTDDEDERIALVNKFERMIFFDVSKYMLSGINYDAKYVHIDKIAIERQTTAIQNYQGKIDDLQAQNTTLKAELANAKKLAKNAPVMTYKQTSTNEENDLLNDSITKLRALTLKAKETELYPQELREIVMDSLAEYRAKYVQDGSRRADVLDSVLQNTTYDKKIKAKEKEIVDAMKAENTTSPAFLSSIEKLGFKVKSKSNHTKLQYMNDPRYTIVIAKTPSDINANKNATREIINKCL